MNKRVEFLRSCNLAARWILRQKYHILVGSAIPHPYFFVILKLPNNEMKHYYDAEVFARDLTPDGRSGRRAL